MQFAGKFQLVSGLVFGCWVVFRFVGVDVDLFVRYVAVRCTVRAELTCIVQPHAGQEIYFWRQNSRDVK